MTYQGTIIYAGGGVAVSSKTTAVPFKIPRGAKSLLVYAVDITSAIEVEVRYDNLAMNAGLGVPIPASTPAPANQKVLDINPPPNAALEPVLWVRTTNAVNSSLRVFADYPPVN